MAHFVGLGLNILELVPPLSDTEVKENLPITSGHRLNILSGQGKKEIQAAIKNKNVKKSIFSFSDFLLLQNKNFVAPQISMNCNFFVSNRKLLNQC